MINANISGFHKGMPSNHPSPGKPRWILPLLLILVGLGAYFFYKSRKNGGISGDDLIREVVGSEEVILELTPALEKLSRGLMNLKLPSQSTNADLFGESVSVIDIEQASVASERQSGFSLAKHPIYSIAGGARTLPRNELSLWGPLLAEVNYFDNAQFKIVMGEFVGDGGANRAFQASVKFSGLARGKSGKWLGLSAKQSLTWNRHAEGGWKITAWELEKMEVKEVPRRLFSDRMEDALPSPADRHRARHSIHEEELVKYYQSGKKRARSHDFAPISMPQKPGVSVVDIDGDGFDDIYVMVRMGQNLLLRNRGDGTFEDVAAANELAVAGNSTCGIFADFDNDGDPDLLLGRSLERCQYFENTGVWFSEIKTSWTEALPLLAISMSAADYNGDGLLDFYICTYRPEALGDTNPGLNGIGGGSGNTGLTWPERFLPEKDAAEYMRRHNGDEHDFLDQIGPPNSLWINLGGGKFGIAPESGKVGVWENTLQATWADFDDDGDPDLYLANDFASDNLFRNDGIGGFTDVAKSVGVGDYGFGMGASFGDYNLDGRQDLYVSNMFSKAGRRILAKFEGINPDYVRSAEGNFLYSQGEPGFELVSSLEGSGHQVAEAGWSWGGQFADFDNDTDLDIYALSGYFTAPEEVASEVDL